MRLDLSFFKRTGMLDNPIYVKSPQEIYRGGRRGYVLVGVPVRDICRDAVRRVCHVLAIRGER